MAGIIRNYKLKWQNTSDSLVVVTSATTDIYWVPLYTNQLVFNQITLYSYFDNVIVYTYQAIEPTVIFHHVYGL